MLKCVNLIEIRFYAYLYASCFLVLWHIIFETTAQIPEVEYGGKYGYMRANTDIWGQIRIFAPYFPWGQITNTDCYVIKRYMDRNWTASFSIRFRKGTCIIILDKKYNIANSSCQLRVIWQYIWTVPSPKKYYMNLKLLRSI